MFRRIISAVIAVAMVVNMAMPTVYAMENTECVQGDTIQQEQIVDETTDDSVDANDEEISDNAAETKQDESEEILIFESGESVQEFSATDFNLPENDEMFAAYVEQQFYGNSFSAFGVNARERLNDDEKKIYDFLKAEIETVAKNGGSTVFIAADLSDIGVKNTWTAAELGVEYLLIDEVSQLFAAQFDLSKIHQALLTDCPYDLYWYDKTEGIVSSYGFTGTGYYDEYGVFQADYLKIINYYVSFRVAGNYSDNLNVYAVTSDVSRVGSAADNAKDIADKYKNETIYNKLVAFKNEICSLVTYDHSAAYSGVFSENNDPWQLINVFDGDTDTNVVCEGYSKAFMYLCDLSEIECYTVSGSMCGATGAGGHMWNIVVLDGKNYLADVTNSDTGTIGYNGELFLTGTAGSVEYGYDFYVNGTNVFYSYYTETIGLLGNEILQLAESKYIPSLHIEVIDEAVAPTCTETGLTEGSHCSVCNKIIVTQEVVDALGHSFTNYISDGDATCTEDGHETAKCDRCNITDSRIDEGSALGHNHVGTVTGPTCTEKGYTTYECTRCEDSYVADYVDAKVHEFGEWGTIKLPTANQYGEDSRYCVYCNTAETRDSMPLGHVSKTAEVLEAGQNITLMDKNIVMNDKQMYFYAELDQFENGIMRMGHGKTSYASQYIEITPTHLKDWYYYTDSSTKCYSYSHGLDIKDWIEVHIVKGTGSASITIRTATGEFVKICDWRAGSNGPIFCETEDVTIRNVDVRWWCDRFSSDYWFFGDSWFSTGSSARWTSYLLKDGYSDILLCAYGGMKAQTGIEQFKEFLKYDTPKYAVWCLGMNNGDRNGKINTSWFSATKEFISVCEAYNITPILSSVPTTPKVNNRLKNAWIQESGYRYIDFDLAVVENHLTGEWYEGLAAADLNHPTELGAQALYPQVFVDFPELARADAETCLHKLYHLDAKVAKCKNSGRNEYYICSLCSSTFADIEAKIEVFTQDIILPALGHDYEETVTEPTCTEQGYTTYTCTRCEDSYVADHVDALGHTEEIDEAEAPTCTETGLTEGKHCSVCNEVLVPQTAVDAFGHTEITVEAVAPTCAETGLTEGKCCSVCEEIIIAQEGIEALGHNYEGIVTEPNCKEQGYTAYECTRCDDSYIADYEDALGHNFANYQLADDGTKVYTCDRCGETKVVGLPENIVCTIGDQVKLTVELDPNGETDENNLIWTAEDETVAIYDEETSMLKVVGPGTTTVTVTDSVTGYTSSTKVTVKLPKTEKLTAVWNAEIDKSGLQAGESRTMVIAGSTVGAMAAKYFDFKSSNEKAVTVDENGVITVVFTGSGTASANATITATVKGDATKKVTLTVKAIPKQTADIEITAEYDNAEITVVTDEESGVQTLIIPRSLVKDGTLPVSLKAVAKDAQGNEVITNVKWTSDAASIAKVVAVKGTTDSADVTVGKNVDGLAVITATANDLKKTTATIEIDVRDYTPRLENNTVTLNTYLEDGVQVGLYTAYDAILKDYPSQAAMFLAEETEVIGVNLSGTGSENFFAEYDSESGMVTFNSYDVMAKNNAQYKLTLNVNTAKGETSQPVTIKVANKLPAVTVKQTAPFEMFYKDSTSDVTVTAKDAVITAVEMPATATFTASAYDAEKEGITISYRNHADPLSTFVNNKPDAKTTLAVSFEGYRAVYEVKNFAIKTKETKVTLGQSRAATKYTALGNDNTPINVINTKTKEVIDLTECTVTAQSASAGYVTVTANGTELTINPMLNGDGKFAVNNGTNHAAKVDVQHNNWLRPVTISHNISINTAVPSMKLKAANLKLNSVFDTQAATVIVPSIDNCPQFIWTVTEQPTKTQTAEEFAKLNVTVNGWDVTATFADKNNVPVKGNYKYLLTTFIAGKEVKLTLTVNVAETLPNVTVAKTSVKLNSAVNEDTVVPFKVPAGYEVTGAVVTNSKGNVLTDADIRVEYIDGEIAVKAVNENLAKGNYRYDIIPVVKLAGEEYSKETQLKKAVVLTVNVYNGVPNVTYTAKGKIDLVNRDTGIVYTLTKGTNFVYSADDVATGEFKLIGTDADKFNLTYLGTDAKGQHMVEVKANADAQLKKGAKYSYNIAANIDGIVEPVTMLKAVTVSPSQSTVKYAVKGSTTIYQSYKGTNSLRIEAASPAGVKISRVEIDAKATMVPKGVEVVISETTNADGSWNVTYTLTKASAVKVNKTYKLALKVTPEGGDETVKPTVVNVTLKVKR